MGLLAGLFAATLFSTGAMAATIKFAAHMDAKSEVPPKTSAGIGDVLATLDTSTKVLTYTVTFEGLTGPATMGHFHGPAPVGKNAGVAVPFPAPVVSPLTAKATLTAKQMADLEAGMWYANIHTAANPGGEIRGQMMKVK
jgi:hypothetical protein